MDMGRKGCESWGNLMPNREATGEREGISGTIEIKWIRGEGRQRGENQ